PAGVGPPPKRAPCTRTGRPRRRPGRSASRRPSFARAVSAGPRSERGDSRTVSTTAEPVVPLTPPGPHGSIGAMSATADVVVVGGGCNGASLAFHLAEGKAGRVVLLEKGALASGPTGRSTAIVRQHYSNEVTARMALDSLRVFQEWEDRIGGTCGFVRTGFLVGVRDGDRTALEGNVALQRGVGIDVRLVGADELRRLEPQLFAEDLVAGAYEPEAGYCDPVSTTTSFAEAARGRGARIVQGREVTAIRIERGRVAGVETAAGSVAAPVVVVAAGPWARRLVDGVGVALPVEPSRHPVCAFRRPPEFGRAPMI